MSWKGYEFIAFEWVLIAITFSLVAIRLHVSYTLQFRRLTWQEIFPIGAWLLYLGVGICDSIMNSYHYINTDYSHFEALPRDQQIINNKAGYAFSFFYKPCMYFCKASLLCFYMDISPRNQLMHLRRMIYVTWFFTGAGFFVQICYNLFNCRPFRLNWEPEGDSCGFAPHYFYVNWVLHIFTDVLIYIIPFFIVYQAKRLTLSKKIGILSMFAVGFVNILVACVFLYLSVQDEMSTEAFGAYTYLCTLQLFTAIVIICMPQLRLLYRKKVSKRTGDVDIFPWKKNADVPTTVTLMHEASMATRSDVRSIHSADHKGDSMKVTTLPV